MFDRRTINVAVVPADSAQDSLRSARAHQRASRQSRAGEQHSALGPPQFSLRCLLVTTAVIFLLIALFDWAGPVWTGVLTLGLVLIVGHVLGNVVGTRLRNVGSKCQDVHESVAAENVAASRVRLASPLRVSHLRIRTPLERQVWLAIASGVVGGGLLGGTLLATHQQQSITWIGLLVGAVSAAVLGGWLSLLVVTFFHVVRRCWREAVEHHDRSI